MSAPLPLEILVTKLDNDAVIPTYAIPGDAGADLYSISVEPLLDECSNNS